MNEELDHIDYAFDLLIFGCKLKAYLKNGVNSNEFNKPITLKTGVESFDLEKTDYNPQKIDNLSENLLIAILAKTVEIVHEACELIFLEKIKILLEKNHFSNLDQSRMFLYLLRCSFSHTPINPTWNIKRDVFRQIHIKFSDEVILEFSGYFNSKDLNGATILPKHFGGVGNIMRLIIYLKEEAVKLQS